MKNRNYMYPLLAAILLVGTATSVVTVAGAASTGASTITAAQSATGSGSQPSRTPPAAFGKVTAISGTTITISDQKPGAASATTYTVDASGATVTKDRGTDSSISAIAVGDMIAVEGTISGSTVTATAIHDGVGGPGGRGGFGGPGGGTIGTVTAISGSTLTVTDRNGGIFTVDASSATVKESGSASSVSAIKIGDTVMIRGSITAASMTAQDIEDGIPTPPTTSASGTLTQ